MIQPEQLQQDIAALPESAQALVAEFVTFLKSRYATSSTSALPELRPLTGDGASDRPHRIANVLEQLAEADPFHAIADPVTWQQTERVDRALPLRDL